MAVFQIFWKNSDNVNVNNNCPTRCNYIQFYYISVDSSIHIFVCCWPCILVIFDFMFQLNAPFVYYIYHIPLHVSSNTVLIIRRIHCIHTASGSLYVTLRWPLSAQAVRGLARGQSSNCLCTERSPKKSYLQRTRCCVYTIVPPDDEHNIARNMYRNKKKYNKQKVHEVGTWNQLFMVFILRLLCLGPSRGPLNSG